MTRLLIAALAALLAFAAPSMAATPFNAGSGEGHDLAVGSDGTGFVAWIQNDGVEDEVGYCRVPAGGAACDTTLAIDFPDTTASNPTGGSAQVFTPAPNEVVIVASCWGCGAGGVTDRVYRFDSANNGASFGAGVEIGNDVLVEGQAGYLPAGETVLGVEGGLFMGMNAPPVEDTELTLGGGFPFVYDPAVVPGPDASTVVHALDDLDNVKYAVFNDPGGAGITPAELNNVANWDSGKVLTGAEDEDNSETSLSSGSNGVLLTYQFFIPSAGGDHLGFRRFDAATQTFGAPVYIEGPNSIDNEVGYPFHSQDGGGRIHAVWRSLYDGGRLRYTRSDDGGATWTPAANLSTHDTYIDPIVEAGPAGTGFAVWTSTSSDAPIRVVAIDPVFEADPSAAPPGGDVPGTPDVTDLGIGDSTLTPGAGTTFTFSTTEGGRAVLTFQKRVKGLKLKVRGKRRCVPRTKKRLRKLRRAAGSKAAYRRVLRRRSCKTWKRIGEIRQDVAAGQNQIAWNGRIAGRRLSPGLYRAALVITDPAGNKSRVERVRFRVRRR